MESMEIINLKRSELIKKGFYDIDDWLSRSNHIYIGGKVASSDIYLNQSKWYNPFSVKKHGLDEFLMLYEDYIKRSRLYNELDELEGMSLGCWCLPEKCHGSILLKLLAKKKATGTA